MRRENVPVTFGVECAEPLLLPSSRNSALPSGPWSLRNAGFTPVLWELLHLALPNPKPSTADHLELHPIHFSFPWTLPSQEDFFFHLHFPPGRAGAARIPIHISKSVLWLPVALKSSNEICWKFPGLGPVFSGEVSAPPISPSPPWANSNCAFDTFIFAHFAVFQLLNCIFVGLSLPFYFSLRWVFSLV